MTDETRHSAELEALLREAAPDDAQRAEVAEAHRLLEHDLSRLVDPLPPPDFLQHVMARVAAAPPPAPSRSDVVLGTSIFFAALAGSIGAIAASGNPSTQLGVAAARLAVDGRHLLVALASAGEAVWRTAALPAVAMVVVALTSCVWGLGRLLPRTTMKVTS
ncbi:MAG: hypothetical protein JNG84_09535 [Archangium sp.]|nr:hypothetical protein [Archangium sp.]